MTRIRYGLLFALVLAAAIAVGVVLVTDKRKVEGPRAPTTGAEPQASARPQAKRPRRAPPPLFSPEYVKSLEGVLEIEAEEALNLEQKVRARPSAWAKRLRLLAYYTRADQAARPESRRARKRHIFWLIEHQPDSEILASPCAILEPGVLAADEEKRATALWEHALAARPTDAKVLWNAAQFFRERNQEASVRFMREGLRLAPDNWHYGHGLGLQLASRLVTAMRRGDESGAGAVLRELEGTSNAAVLGPVLRLLQSEYNASLMVDREKPIFREKAQQLFARLQALDPDVDRAWVLPEMKPEMIGMLARPPSPENRRRLVEKLQTAVRRLQVEDFPELPPGVTSVLRSRGCTIPQPRNEGPKLNVIQGQFFRKGQPGWAVLCSRASKSSILVFRHDNDSSPDEIAQSEDDSYLVDTGQGWTSYARQISAADWKFIERHYRAYGGPEPPLIDHYGVDDAFLEKASITWYWHKGKWMRLQGAD